MKSESWVIGRHHFPHSEVSVHLDWQSIDHRLIQPVGLLIKAVNITVAPVIELSDLEPCVFYLAISGQGHSPHH